MGREREWSCQHAELCGPPPLRPKGVVLIDTELRYAGARGAGTGIVLTSSGQIMTNYHVVEGTTSIAVTVASTGATYPATVVGHDQTHDVALLQLEDASGLDPIALDRDPVAVGDQVTAVGNAGGTGSLTAAEGNVTALNATVTTAAEGAVAAETLTSMIETDADVVAGDSGGPLFDAQGEVTGINTAGSSGPQIDSFAIPIKEALSVVEQINTGTETDTVQVGASPMLGVLLGDTASSPTDRRTACPAMPLVRGARTAPVPAAMARWSRMSFPTGRPLRLGWRPAI